MSKRILLTLCLLVLCVSISGAGITDKLKSVIARKNVAGGGAVTIGPISVATNDDDGNIVNNVGYHYAGGVGGELYIGHWDDGRSWAIARFTLDAAIPSGATIDTDLTKVEYYSTYNGNDNLYFYVTDSKDAAQVTHENDRPVLEGAGATTTYPSTAEHANSPNVVDWPASGWKAVLIGGLIQYLVDKAPAGLSSGAHIVVWGAGIDLATDVDVGWVSYEDSTNPAKITIVYTP